MRPSDIVLLLGFGFHLVRRVVVKFAASEYYSSLHGLGQGIGGRWSLIFFWTIGGICRDHTAGLMCVGINDGTSGCP